MMLVDKGYYDYDFERKVKIERILVENTMKNKEETMNILARFGIGRKREESLEELQEMAMKQLNEK